MGSTFSVAANTSISWIRFSREWADIHVGLYQFKIIHLSTDSNITSKSKKYRFLSQMWLLQNTERIPFNFLYFDLVLILNEAKILPVRLLAKWKID